MTTLPKTQRAWRVVRQGHPSKALEFTQSAPVRCELKDGEVLLKVGAGALNPVYSRFMRVLPNFIARRPYDAAEIDLAGTVVLSKSPLHSVGDKVYGYLDLGKQPQNKQGALAEYTIANGAMLVRRPDGKSATDCAGVPLTSMTAYMALFDIAGLEEGQTVFVNGGSSSVGAYAIQLAKARGLKVWASASGKNEDFVRGLGADEFLDYTRTPLESVLSKNPPSPKFDCIFDAVGLLSPSLYTHSEAYLAPGGLYVSAGNMPDKLDLSGIATMVKLIWAAFLHPQFIGGTRRKYVLYALDVKRERLEAVAALLAEDKIRSVVDSVHSFENALQAYKRQMSKRAVGKVIVSIDPEA